MVNEQATVLLICFFSLASSMLGVFLGLYLKQEDIAAKAYAKGWQASKDWHKGCCDKGCEKLRSLPVEAAPAQIEKIQSVPASVGQPQIQFELPGIKE